MALFGIFKCKRIFRIEKRFDFIFIPDIRRFSDFFFLSHSFSINVCLSLSIVVVQVTWFKLMIIKSRRNKKYISVIRSLKKKLYSFRMHFDSSSVRFDKTKFIERKPTFWYFIHYRCDTPPRNHITIIKRRRRKEEGRSR